MKLILRQPILTTSEDITSCCMSVNGEIFFTDHDSKTLSVVAPDGTFKYNMLLGTSHGFDITFIDKRTIVITSVNSHMKFGIVLIDTEIQKKIRFVSHPSRPYGITRYQDSLFVCVDVM